MRIRAKPAAGPISIKLPIFQTSLQRFDFVPGGADIFLKFEFRDLDNTGKDHYIGSAQTSMSELLRLCKPRPKMLGSPSSSKKPKAKGSYHGALTRGDMACFSLDTEEGSLALAAPLSPGAKPTAHTSAGVIKIHATLHQAADEAADQAAGQSQASAPGQHTLLAPRSVPARTLKHHGQLPATLSLRGAHLAL